MPALKSILQLMRFPAVFTALADILLGASLVAVADGEWGLPGGPGDLLLLMIASAGLYLAGMVWNDVFDLQQDSVERPQRPIPSGRVSLPAARTIGSVLVLTAWAAAAAVGWRSFAVAVAVTVCVFAYDGLLKQTSFAPLVMGLCRMGNVLLGASLAASAAGSHVWGFPLRVVAVSAGTGLYIVGVTCFARNEAGTIEPRRLGASLLLIATALVLLTAGIVSGWLQPAVDASMSGLLMVMVSFFVVRRGVWALARPDHDRIQAAVRSMLLSICLLDAVLLYALTGHVMLAGATAVLCLPALLIGRWLYMT